MKTLLAISFGIIGTLATSAIGLSAPVLDQAFVPETWTISGSIGLNPATYFGQSFTAGKTGKLSQVRLEIYDSPLGTNSPPLRISLFDAPNGEPASLPLASVDLVNDQLTLLTPISFDSPIDVVAGGRYLISAHYPSLTQSFYAHSDWMGRSSDGYSGGAAFYGEADQFGSLVWRRVASRTMPEADFSFETYVDSEQVPEPQAFYIAATAMAVAGDAARRFRRPQ